VSYGDGPLQRGDSGDAVGELQMRLAGFRGTVPDGSFGPGTELQVVSFQRDVMQRPMPDGKVDKATFDAIESFGQAHAFDLAVMHCPCGHCEGFGQKRFKGLHRSGQPKDERFHRYEYPGIHRMLLWAYMAAIFYCRRQQWELSITSGYRCHEDNLRKGRSSTNHHGKAIDFQRDGVAGGPDQMAASDAVRGLLVSTANAQVGWGAANRKSLEPSNIAPTWVHYDVRSYERRYLSDRYFVRSADELFGVP